MCSFFGYVKKNELIENDEDIKKMISSLKFKSTNTYIDSKVALCYSNNNGMIKLENNNEYAVVCNGRLYR